MQGGWLLERSLPLRAGNLGVNLLFGQFDQQPQGVVDRPRVREGARDVVVDPHDVAVSVGLGVICP